MSSFGGAFIGDSSNILISDFTKALAYIGSGVSYTVSRLFIAHPDCYGFSPFRNIQNTIAVEESFPYEFQIDSGSSEIPLVFFDPSIRMAVTRVYKNGATYWVTVVCDNSTLPKIYMFAPKTYSGTEKTGMKVINATGEPMFDSRNNNLAIKDIVTASSPTITNVGSTSAYWAYDNGAYVWSRDKVQNIKASGSTTKVINVANIAKPIVCVNSISTANLAATAKPFAGYYEKFDGNIYTRDYYVNGFDNYKNGVYYYDPNTVGLLSPYPDRNSYGIHYRRKTQYPNTTQKDWAYQFKDWCNYRIACTNAGNKSTLTFSWIMNQAGCYTLTGSAGYYETIVVTGSGGNPPYERYGVQNAGDFSVLVADGADYD